MNASTKQRTELSVIPKGHWRNQWFSDDNVLATTTPPCVPIGGSRWLGGMKHVSAELAEQRAVYCINRHPRAYRAVTYLGPVFFPDGGSNA